MYLHALFAASAPIWFAKPIKLQVSFRVYAGSVWFRVSTANGISSNPKANAMEVIATGVPSDPKCRTPAPTRKVIPAAPKRANEVEKAKALARHSVGYCSGSHRV